MGQGWTTVPADAMQGLSDCNVEDKERERAQALGLKRGEGLPLVGCCPFCLYRTATPT